MKPYTDIEQSRLNTMTQEEQIKRYDVALSIAKNIYGASESKDILCTLETIFPELRESEDERIRKWLIGTIKQIPDNSIEWKTICKSDVLAWLEKRVSPDMVADAYLRGYNDAEKKLLEKHGYEVVEPKFKVGDWVVQENIGVYKVIEICESWYEVIDGEDNHYSISFDKEHMCHLWSIEDAKRGDILVSVDNNYPFIYKGRLDPNHPNSPVAYCGIDTGGDFCAGEYKFNYWWTDAEVQPATKEQRDLLFQKMKEAEYEWDAEKKELEN